jgi:hypothetical protein
LTARFVIFNPSADARFLAYAEQFPMSTLKAGGGVVDNMRSHKMTGVPETIDATDALPSRRQRPAEVKARRTIGAL